MGEFPGRMDAVLSGADLGDFQKDTCARGRDGICHLLQAVRLQKGCALHPDHHLGGHRHQLSPGVEPEQAHGAGPLDGRDLDDREIRTVHERPHPVCHRRQGGKIHLHPGIPDAADDTGLPGVRSNMKQAFHKEGAPNNGWIVCFMAKYSARH